MKNICFFFFQFRNFYPVAVHIDVFAGNLPAFINLRDFSVSWIFYSIDFIFAEKLDHLDIHYVHPVKEHAWGQRVVRFYDPDGHIIEVGETMKTVCRRFLAAGMTPEQAAERMDVPLKFVRACMR